MILVGVVGMHRDGGGGLVWGWGVGGVGWWVVMAGGGGGGGG